MSGINKVILIGNLGADPEIRTPKTAVRSPTCASPPAKTGKTAIPVSAKSAPSGILWPCTLMVWWVWSSNT